MRLGNCQSHLVTFALLSRNEGAREWKGTSPPMASVLRLSSEWSEAAFSTGRKHVEAVVGADSSRGLTGP